MTEPRLHLRPLALTLAASAFLVACGDDKAVAETAAPQQVDAPASAAAQVTPAAVVAHYADLGHAVYQDALITARKLDKATDELLEAPSPDTLEAAREAWRAARVPYQQSEVFRFGNAIVDDWEGQLNAWPLDEGLIDYVDGDRYHAALGNGGANANIVASSVLTVGDERIDVTQLTPELLASLNELGGSEANVATGYHAIEFLLWGQDLHGFDPGAGNRPATDYATGADCTGGHCDRRAAYLDAVTDLLVADLEWMVAQWAPANDGNYRAELLAAQPRAAIEKMLFGMGSLSLGELAGERMKVALEANAYEDEHDCFSDNTHNSHFYDGQGIQNIYTGTYKRIDGSSVAGPSLSALVAEADPELDATLRTQLEASMAALGHMKHMAEAEANPVTFDMMIAPGNAEGAKTINRAIAALVQQTGTIEQVALQLGVSVQPDDAGHAF